MTRKGRHLLSALGTLMLLATTLFFPPNAAYMSGKAKAKAVRQEAKDETVGTPQTLGEGITESVASMMERERLNPTKSSERHVIKNELEVRREMLSPKMNPDSPLVPQWPPVSAEADEKIETPQGIFRKSELPAKNNAEATTNTPQTIGLNFRGIVETESGGSVPPDTHGAVGPSQIITATNLFIRSFGRNGMPDNVLSVSLNTFFNSVRNGNGLSDPRIKYDRLSQRWFISIITTNAPRNAALLAVSSGPVITPTSTFTFFRFAVDAGGGGASDNNAFLDYDTLGIDANAVYIGGNIFNGTLTAFLGTTIYVIRKSDLLAATPQLTLTAFRQLGTATAPGVFTPYGLSNDDPAATDGFVIGVDTQSFGLLVLRRISNPGGVPSISGNINLTVPATTFPLNVPALGTVGVLDSLDDRLFEAQIKNGSIWAAHNIQVDATGVASDTGGRTGSRFYQIGNLSGTPTLVQAGTLFSSAAMNPDFFWIPSIGVTGQGHAAVGTSVAGATRRAGIAFAGRLSGDALGTLRAPTIALDSQFAYNSFEGSPFRWGDYSQTVVDPNDDMTLWTFQEYTDSTDTWGTRVVQLLAPPPATPNAASPSSLGQGRTANITVTGLSTAGSGFFDPGPSFPNRLRATVSGTGVTVNNVTFTNPTTAVLSVTAAAGTTIGPRDITITNPDGQSATGTGLLNITATNCPPITVSPATLPTTLLAGVPFTQAFTATGGMAPITFSSVGTLPPGLTLTGNTLSGSPMTAGTFTFTIVATDANGCTGVQAYTVTVGATNLQLGARTVITDNGIIEPNECNMLNVVLSNAGTADVANAVATLSTTTPGVTIAQPSSAYPTIPAGGGMATNATPFQISTSPSVACGSTINLTLTVAFTGGSSVFTFSLPVGQPAGTNYAFTSSTGNMITPGATLVPGSQADDAVALVAAPFNFSVYGTNVTAGMNITVSTNGNLQLVSAGGSTTLTNQSLPAAGVIPFPANAPILFPYWDDLDLRGTTNGVFTSVTGTAPNRVFNVEWRGVLFATTSTVNFQIRFFEGTNRFEYVYNNSAAANGASATIGVQAATTGMTFTQFSFNTASVMAGQRLAAQIPAGICTPGTGECGAGAVNVNGLVSLTVTNAVSQPTTCMGNADEVAITATLTNTSSTPISSLSFMLVELRATSGAPPVNPFRLLSANGATCTMGGLPGAIQTGPAMLAPGASTPVTFRILRPELRRFLFNVNVLGTPMMMSGTSVPGAKSSTLVKAKPASAFGFELSPAKNPSVATMKPKLEAGATLQAKSRK
jgi:Putative Ig domain